MHSKSDGFGLDRVVKTRQRAHSVSTSIHRFSPECCRTISPPVREHQGIVATLCRTCLVLAAMTQAVCWLQ